MMTTTDDGDDDDDGGDDDDLDFKEEEVDVGDDGGRLVIICKHRCEVKTQMEMMV